MPFHVHRHLLQLARRVRCRRLFSSAESTKMKKNPPSSYLTHQLSVQPKVFERELWAIYDNIEQHPWTSKEKLTEIRQKIVDLKKMKKELNLILNRQRNLKDKHSRLVAQVEEEGADLNSEGKALVPWWERMFRKRSNLQVLVTMF